MEELLEEDAREEFLGVPVGTPKKTSQVGRKYISDETGVYDVGEDAVDEGKTATYNP